jgi:hypothetical protein
MSSGEVSSRMRMVFFPWFFQAQASSAVKTACPEAAPGDAASPTAITSWRAFSVDIEDGMEELVQGFRLDFQQGFVAADELFGNEVDGDLDGGHARPLAVSGLEHIEPAFLDGEFEILDVAVVLFQPLVVAMSSL